MKKVKFILPVVAIVFAVAGVFATGNSTSALINDNVSLGQHHPDPNKNCDKDGTCTNNGGSTCATASGLALTIRTGGGSCSGVPTGTFTYAP